MRRINWLGVSHCRLLKVNGLDLHVEDLDAVDGTPILYIKPWFTEFGPPGEIGQTQWTTEMLADYSAPTGTTRQPSEPPLPSVEDHRDMHVKPARLRAACYVTRTAHGQRELLVFQYDAQPELGTHLPGGGIDPGERPDNAAVREAVEETGVAGRLGVLGAVGVQQGQYSDGRPCISVYFHIETDESRDHWTHTMHGDTEAWDTGQTVNCRFVSMAEAVSLLKASGYQQDEYLDHLDSETSHNIAQLGRSAP